MTIEMFGFVPAIVVPLPVTRVTLQEMVANTMRVNFLATMRVPF